MAGVRPRCTACARWHSRSRSLPWNGVSIVWYFCWGKIYLTSIIPILHSHVSMGSNLTLEWFFLGNILAELDPDVKNFSNELYDKFGKQSFCSALIHGSTFPRNSLTTWPQRPFLTSRATTENREFSKYFRLFSECNSQRGSKLVQNPTRNFRFPLHSLFNGEFLLYIEKHYFCWIIQMNSFRKPSSVPGPSC